MHFILRILLPMQQEYKMDGLEEILLDLKDGLPLLTLSVCVVFM